MVDRDSRPTVGFATLSEFGSRNLGTTPLIHQRRPSPVSAKNELQDSATRTAMMQTSRSLTRIPSLLSPTNRPRGRPNKISNAAPCFCAVFAEVGVIDVNGGRIMLS